VRPNNPIGFATLPVSGIKFQYDLLSIRSKGVRDAGREQLLALIRWGDRDAFLQEAVGFTTFNAGTLRLNRVLPLRHPLRPTYFCDEYELESFGAYETRTDFGIPDPAPGAPLIPTIPAQDWARYLLSFSRPKARLHTDLELSILPGGAAGKEQYRYTWESVMPLPRNRRVSSFGFEFQKPDGTWAAVPDETQFVPDYAVDLVCTWLQVPALRAPFLTILDTLNTVNATPIRLSPTGYQWPPQWLAFKGLARPLEVYEGADGGLYYDLAYRFTAQPGTWNKYLSRDAAGGKVYRPIRIRSGAGAGFDPFVTSEFQDLFVAG
jgi:hypothetical protein